MHDGPHWRFASASPPQGEGKARLAATILTILRNEVSRIVANNDGVADVDQAIHIYVGLEVGVIQGCAGVVAYQGRVGIVYNSVAVDVSNEETDVDAGRAKAAPGCVGDIACCQSKDLLIRDPRQADDHVVAAKGNAADGDAATTTGIVAGDAGASTVNRTIEAQDNGEITGAVAVLNT